MQPLHVQLFDLTLIQLTNWRWSWRASVIVSVIAPVFMIVVLSVFAGDDNPEVLGYVLTGNMVLTLLMEGVNKVSGHFMFIRTNGTLDYFASLPVYRISIILATVGAFLVLSLPAVIATLAIGTAILGLPLNINPMIVVVVPLISISLSGLGAIIGLLARNPAETSSFGLLISMFLFGFGPVLYPVDRFPEIISTLSLLSPATYAASALRQVVLGMPDRIPLTVDIAVLAGIAVVLLWVVNSRIEWRGR
ncbi:MAG: ABC transporter permease [Anaerolineae bacterium]|nr:ABC transporter permease [Anaerolineae bacterium]